MFLVICCYVRDYNYIVTSTGVGNQDKEPERKCHTKINNGAIREPWLKTVEVYNYRRSSYDKEWCLLFHLNRNSERALYGALNRTSIL